MMRSAAMTAAIAAAFAMGNVGAIESQLQAEAAAKARTSNAPAAEPVRESRQVRRARERRLAKGLRR